MNRFPALIDRKGAQMEIHHEYILFTFDDDSTQVQRLTLTSIRISLGGENSNHFYINELNSPEQIISFQDKRALEVLSSLKVNGASDVLKESSKRHHHRIISWSSPFFFIIISVFIIPLLFSLSPIHWLNGILSIKQERNLGELILKAIYTRSADGSSQSVQENALLTLVNLIKDQNPSLKEIDYEVFISASQEINAFALPGGIIVFNQGLLDKSQSTEEICGVLAHEMAHVELRHLLKSMVGNVGQLLSVSMVGFFLGSEGANWFMRGSNLVSLKYSRDDETEADKRGLEFLRNSRIDPRGLVNFFTRLKSDSNLNTVMSRISFFSTHPASDERINMIRTAVELDPYTINSQLPVKLEDFFKKNQR